ncbi:histidine phosphatase family protein [Anaerocolumna sedimenticola]|uniref:histidine phosphatase family protein n=1 Tax=Anaerocolumna sedimenticola TaxID=2696063 RepID=UPI001379F865|nr:histidine phosphatase family protein [Anaerocolumna sedimenticola]
MNKPILDLLREGGLILYARHGEATIGEDLPNLNYRYCLTQRNLSELGRWQAFYYGQILRKLRIPINYLIQTSPFCRTIETAGLAFGWSNISVDPFWAEINNLSTNISADQQRKILDTLQTKLEIIPPQGTNKVIIAHNFPNQIGLGQIPDMGTVVIRPLGQGNG